MSRIPYLDDLGDALESAARRSASTASRQRGWAVATAAFTAVILIGAFWWAIAPRSDTVAVDPSDTSTTAPPSLGAHGPLPAEWGRVRPQTALSGQGRLTLSGIVWDGERFIAVGTDGSGEDNNGVALTSSDGVAWDEIARIPDVTLHDVAFGSGRLVVVGTRGFLPIALRSSDAIEWEFATLPFPPGPEGRIGQADTVAASGSGFVAGGSVQASGDEPAQSPAVWRSTDGLAWTAVDDAVFATAVEATVNDIVVADGMVVAVGLVSAEAGASVPIAWVSDSSEPWSQVEMPLGDDSRGFAGATALAHGPAGWVAVGFASGTSGRTGAVWASSDGRVWERVVDSADVLGGAVPNASTRMHDITTTGLGYVAVGSTVERPLLRYVFWTSPNGRDWRRFDLEDPDGGLPASSAHAVAANPDLVAVAGAALDVAGDLAQGAVWLSPPPSEVTASVPIAPDESVVDDPVAVLTVGPDRAVQATQLRVRGRLPEDSPAGDPVVVWLHASSGPSLALCEANRQGRNFACRPRLGDFPSPPAPGEYFLSVEPASPAAEEGVALEVLPEGATVMVLSAVYSSNWWPLLQSLHVSNKGAEAVDLGGWSLENAVGGAASFEFPAGTIVIPGDSVTVAFGSTFGATCFENTESFFNWCRVVGDGDTVNYTDEQAFWKGGEVYLVDSAGEIHDTWQVPR